MKQKKLMVVAGGDWQVPIIRKAREMGLFVINTNLYADSPGFRCANIGLVADVLDRTKQLAFAREHRPDGILTDQSDIAVTTVAYLSEQLGLPGIRLEKAELFTNKYLMRQFLKSHGYDTPAFQICSSPLQAADFASEHGYPVVLKPLANQSSRGVFKVNAETELHQRYPQTLQFSQRGQVLVEQFLQGTEVTVEGIKTHARHYSLAVSRKRHLAHNPMVASELFYSPTIEDMDYEVLKRQHNALVEEMCLPFGITHAEYIFSRGRFFLVEVAARGGGTKISSDIVPSLSGIETNALLIKMSLGERIESVTPRTNGIGFALLAFFNFKPGVVRSVSGIETVHALPGVLDIAMNFRPGEHLEPPADDRARHGYFIATAATADGLKVVSRQIQDTVKVTYA